MKFPHISMTTMLLATGMFAALPSSSSYQLNNYGFGSGGTNNSTSTTYGLNATTGETSNQQSGSATYLVRPGNVNAQQAYVPVAPTFTNPASYYNQLKFVINPGTSPSDTKFSIAISTDSFATTNYVQLDDTIGAGKVYQTYASWGGSSGQLVIGLATNTTYQLKANAIQGNFTETEYGPLASAATVAPTITLAIGVAVSDTITSPPYALTIPSLLPAAVVNTNEKIWLHLSTNAVSGASIYITSLNGGLKSTTASYTLASSTADLASAGTGFGAQVASATQTSGGPLTSVAPYNGAGQNVGILNATFRQIFTTSAPVTVGDGSIQIKAKASNLTPSASDYGDTLTLTTAGTF